METVATRPWVLANAGNSNTSNAAFSASNQAFGTLAPQVIAASNAAFAALPKAGGTLTGALTCTTIDTQNSAINAGTGVITGRLAWSNLTSVPTASTSNVGVVQLDATTNSASTTAAATASAVKDAYDKAAAALPLSGGTLTGVLGVVGNTHTDGQSHVISVFKAAAVAGVNDAGIAIGSINGNTPYISDTSPACSLGISFRTSNATRMQIAPNGNMGVGTTAPEARLHVKATAPVRGILQENCSADDTTVKTTLGSKTYTTHMPCMMNNTMYIYGTGTTANTYYRFVQPLTAYFTGQHAGVPDDADIKRNIKRNIASYTGLIVSSADTGYVSYNPITGERVDGAEAITINEALPNIRLASADNDPAVFGVISDRKDNCSHNPDGSVETDADPQFADDLHDRVRVNSIGEGGIWVCDVNGPIKNGDYITTCAALPGHGRRQDDDLLHNYTVAKATMSCAFELDSGHYHCEEVTQGGQSFRRAFIGCTYHCG